MDVRVLVAEVVTHALVVLVVLVAAQVDALDVMDVPVVPPLVLVVDLHVQEDVHHVLVVAQQLVIAVAEHRQVDVLIVLADAK